MRQRLPDVRDVGFGDIAHHVHDDSRIQAAARLSGAQEVVERLPNQWDTMLGRIFEEGHELSLGEWQKIALARAFLRESPILILDEPTASLDAKQEYDIYRQFDELTHGKTTILISHRFTPVRTADYIYVMDDLRINRHFTLKQNPIRRSDFDEFVELFKPGAMHKRKAAWSESNSEGRWRCYDYEDLLKRDKLSLDLFWIKDDSLEDRCSIH